MSIVLMYHGLFGSEADLREIDLEDQPYAVSLANFESQMQRVSELRHGLLSTQPEAEQPEVVVTFDDGHRSNLTLALPVLEQLGIPAYFFVTTGFMNSRSHFCTGDDLRVLHQAGMVVGSHGVTHRFIGDLPDAEAVDELSRSRQWLSDLLGVGVDTLSFPGGRYRSETLALARDAGYRQIFGSEFGVMDAARLNDGHALQRIAIRQGTTMQRFEQILARDNRLFMTEKVKGQAKTILKKSLGNSLYHGVYKTIAALR